jgi:hypothetical protein
MVVDIRVRMGRCSFPKGSGRQRKAPSLLLTARLFFRPIFRSASCASSPTQRVGTLLGEKQQVNIATFHLGRDAPGGSAIVLVQVDQPISPELMGKIAALRGVVQGQAADLLTELGPQLGPCRSRISPCSRRFAGGLSQWL